MQYAGSKYRKVEVAKFMSNEVDFKMETITGDKKKSHNNKYHQEGIISIYNTVSKYMKEKLTEWQN